VVGCAVAPSTIALNIENRVGALAEVTKILSHAGVTVSGLALGRGPDQRNLRLTVDKPDLAIAELAKHGYEAKRTEVVSVKVSNRPGAIAAVAERLAHHGVNVEAVFLSAKSSKRVELILQVDDVDAARAALRAHAAEEE
jgi:hypothetical protein